MLKKLKAQGDARHWAHKESDTDPSKEEYLALRELHPEIDSESFVVTHPIKNMCCKMLRYTAASMISGIVAYAIKSGIEDILKK